MLNQAEHRRSPTIQKLSNSTICFVQAAQNLFLVMIIITSIFTLMSFFAFNGDTSARRNLCKDCRYASYQARADHEFSRLSVEPAPGRATVKKNRLHRPFRLQFRSSAIKTSKSRRHKRFGKRGSRSSRCPAF